MARKLSIFIIAGLFVATVFLFFKYDYPNSWSLLHGGHIRDGHYYSSEYEYSEFPREIWLSIYHHAAIVEILALAFVAAFSLGIGFARIILRIFRGRGKAVSKQAKCLDYIIGAAFVVLLCFDIFAMLPILQQCVICVAAHTGTEFCYFF